MRVSIIGTGYVGLVTGACLASLGYQVTCVDRVVEKVDAINKGKAPFFEPGLTELLTKHVADGTLTATTNIVAAVQQSEITIIAVGTPSDGKNIDLSYVKAAAEEVGKALAGTSEYHVVAVKSTVIPGTTSGVVREALEKSSGKKAGKDFGLCMNPETLREGCAVQDFLQADRIIIGGVDEKSCKTLAALYAPLECPKLFVSLTEAEMIKYTSNLLFTSLISFSNEIAALCEAIPDADAETVMDAVHLDRRLTPMMEGKRIPTGMLSYLRTSSGFGGSCFPKDLQALRGFALHKNISTTLLDAVAHTNEQRPEHVIELTEKALGSLQDKNIALLGLAFKPGTDDVRESPALAIAHRLIERGAKLRAYDPLAMENAASVLKGKVQFASDTMQTLAGVDAVIIATAWPEFIALNWSVAAKTMAVPVVIDARNALRHVTMPSPIRYFRLGKCY